MLSVASGRITAADLLAMLGEEKTKRGNYAKDENAISSVFSDE
jgi:hypothetical protein